MISRQSSFWLGFIVGLLPVAALVVDEPRCNATAISTRTPLKVAIAKPPLLSECVSGSYHVALVVQMEEARRLMLSNGWEYGGVVFEDTRGFKCVSHPTTSEHPTRLRKAWRIPFDWKAVALYHAHPGLDSAAYMFSGVDVRSACSLGVPSYIVTEDRFMFRFDPHPVICGLHEMPNGLKGQFIGMVQP